MREPLADEFLGGERVTNAKRTRLACDSAVERFENIVKVRLSGMQTNPFGRLKILLAFHLGSLCTYQCKPRGGGGGVRARGGDLTKEQKLWSISQRWGSIRSSKCSKKSPPRGKIPINRQAMHIPLITLIT